VSPFLAHLTMMLYLGAIDESYQVAAW
jgi:hypothetical protein